MSGNGVVSVTRKAECHSSTYFVIPGLTRNLASLRAKRGNPVIDKIASLLIVPCSLIFYNQCVEFGAAKFRSYPAKPDSRGIAQDAQRLERKGGGR